MSFARKGSYRKVYTFRGAEADYEDGIPMTVEEPPKNVDIPSEPRKQCPHGADYDKDGVPICGFCFRQPNSGLTPEQEMSKFLLDLAQICRMVTWRDCHRGEFLASREEKFQIAFDAITAPKNLLRFMDKGTRDPRAMAYAIAHRRLLDFYRSAKFKDRQRRYKQELSVSDLKVPELDGDETLRDSSISTKLEWRGTQPGALAHIERDASLKFPQHSSLHGDVSNRIDALYALQKALEKSESVRVFPGVKLLWSRENIERLMNIAIDALSKLPKRPFDQSVLIRLRANAYGGKRDRMQGWDWPALAKFFNVSEHNVRYAFERGTAEVRAAILRHLTPDLGQIIKETPIRGRIGSQKPRAA